MATTKFSSSDKQVAFVQSVAANPAARAEFLADPGKFADKNKVVLDPKFEALITKELQNIEVEAARLGHRNPHLDIMKVKIPKMPKLPTGPLGARGPVMNAAAVAAGAAVVSAAAAVVSAGPAVYNSTKFSGPGIGGGGRIR